MKANQYKNLKIRLNNGSEISLKQEIGQGSFSNVYQTSNSQYVAKVMNLNYMPSQRSFITEKKYYEQLGSHPNIIKFMAAQEIQDGSLGVLIIENCPKGSLVEIMALTPKNQLSELQILRVIYEVAQGLSYIHKKKLLHRDIKIENILFSEDNHFKICDFGSMTNKIIERISNQPIADIKEEIEKNTTPLYRSPEILDPEIFPEYPIGEKVDIFALGVLAYVLCYKKFPFETALGAINGSCLWPDIPVTSDEFHILITKMLSPCPFDRPTAIQVLDLIERDLKFDYSTDGLIDPIIFSKQSQKEAKASWLQIINVKIFGVFFDTQGWIKGALQYDEFGPKQKYVRKLILKGWKKRPKIDKFYSLLYNHWKENKNNTIINLKILILMHNYFKKGSPEAIKNPIDRKITPEIILEDILRNWQKNIKDGEIIKAKDPKRSQYTCTLITNFSKFLQTKLKLNQKYSQFFEGNFSLNPFLESAKKKFKPLDPLLLPDLIEYLAVIIKFANINLLHQCQLWHIQATIALSILDEIFCALCLILHLYKTFKLATNFESQKYDRYDITQFIQTQDNNIDKMYQQAQLYFKRCSQITDTGIPVASIIPKLPQNAIDYIKSIEILTNNSKQFTIFDHLNYKQSIYGLKLPLSFGPGVIDAIKVQGNEKDDQPPQQQNQLPKQKKSIDLKPPQAQNPRPKSANPSQRQREGSFDSDDYSEGGYQYDDPQNEYPPSNKKYGNSVSSLPQYTKGKLYIPNPHLVLKDQNQNQIPNKQPSPPNQRIENNPFFIPNMQNNDEALAMFEQFPMTQKWDPSHPILVEGYQKEKEEQKFNDTSKGQAYFPQEDLNRSVHLQNNKNIDIMDIDIFDEQYNIHLQNQPSQQPHQTQQVALNPFDQMNSQSQMINNQNNNNNNNQNNQNNNNNNYNNNNNNNNQNINNNNNNQNNNNYYNNNNNNNYNYNNNGNYNYNNGNFNNNNINYNNNNNGDINDLFNNFGNIVANNKNENNQQKVQNQNQQNMDYNNGYQNMKQYDGSNPFDSPTTNKKNDIQMQQQQLMQDIYNQNQFQYQQYNGYQWQQMYNANQNNGYYNYQNQDINMMNNQYFMKQQQDQQLYYQMQQQQIQQQQLQEQQNQHQNQQIINPFKNNALNAQSPQIQINPSPQMSPLKQIKKQSPEINKQSDNPNMNEVQTSRSNKQLIGVDDSDEEEKKNQNQKGGTKIQRLGSENIPDDEAEALRPLDSFLGNQKSFIDPSSQMKRSISPFKNQSAIKSTSDEQLSKSKEDEQREQCQIKIQKHPELVKYIRNEVSSEFFDFIVDYSELTIAEKIGSGNSCEVYRGKYKNQNVAIKVIKLDNQEEIHLKEYQREIQALIKLKNHENLLQLVAISSKDNNFYIVTEFCEGGTLFELLHKKKNEIKMIKWEHRIRWLKDIAKGMSYLHSNNLIHRDLKSLNLLFDKKYDPNSDKIPIMKIADFGLTRVGGSQAIDFNSGAIGTFHWMAPEIMRNKPISTKSDVYSFAIVMWELAARQTPYKDLKNLAAIINFVSDKNGRPDQNKLPFDTPLFIKYLMCLCWHEDPSQRPKFDEIIKILENPSILIDQIQVKE